MGSCSSGNFSVSQLRRESRMSHSKITRHFASITTGRWGPRQVHYRRVGSGPVVICFHQSPLSSRDMLATMERWKDHFTCIAPDSPGFGLSDPLGVDRAAVYGFHTGAMISGAVAAAYPERVVCAAANGYVLLTEQERLDIVTHYLPKLEPKWDGSHLAWLWARLREQTIFFPWYRKSLAARLDFDVPSPEGLQAALLDFMRSGDHYRVGYRAAFEMRSDLALRNVSVPMLVTAADSDVLSIQHDAAGSSEVIHHLALGFIGRRPVVAINLPGHGESDNTLPRGKVTVAAYAKVVLAALDSLGIKEADFVGTWGGGLVGLELAVQAPERIKHVVMTDVLLLDDKLRKDLLEHYAPDIRPVWHGGHLLEAWHLMRDQGLFWPVV
ncbi:MAG: alpha/beta hydrolase [Gammaproteobacteria bacterium]|nr:alpha/beta hydrolase [Gammaproteobacteria bacterium]